MPGSLIFYVLRGSFSRSQVKLGNEYNKYTMGTQGQVGLVPNFNLGTRKREGIGGESTGLKPILLP